MSHTPFILGSYLIGTAVLLWAALAPVINKRGLLRQLKARQARMEEAQ
jgi:heme exporter protein CcmD